ncbi:HAMP domain-containing sensor histidine kinase [Methylobacterium sp. WL6]|uniref:sensor histidine kinase n=1 Tax=Methylobacterium sp. WL6 TaxID=2603901 RepID=UPI002484AC0A|nr:HAMP domain-containing sensor histidine kinase [Methylobacterium sp. WL6]
MHETAPPHARFRPSVAPRLAPLPADPDVIVVGAGAAGIAAARTLIAAGLSVAVLEARDRVGAMRMGLTRIQDLVLNLRKFSRLDEGERSLVNVPEAIETVLALIQHKLGSRIAVERDFAGRPEIHCTPALLNQVVMNILGNAADAMPEGGRIRVVTETTPETDLIRISDTGPGIPEDLREKIFEPFFTTKPVGAGTGLGLAIAYSVVQAHSGSLTVETAPGGGACFVIGIPRQTATV